MKRRVNIKNPVKIMRPLIAANPLCPWKRVQYFNFIEPQEEIKTWQYFLELNESAMYYSIGHLVDKFNRALLIMMNILEQDECGELNRRNSTILN